MTLKEQINSELALVTDLTDDTSIQIKIFLESIKIQIDAKEISIAVQEEPYNQVDLSDVRVARILEFNYNSLKSIVNNGQTKYQPRLDFIERIIPSKLTSNEIETIIQTKLTESPETTVEEMVLIMDEYFYDSESFFELWVIAKPN